MKRRLIQFVTTYFLFVLIFVLQKPIFMGYYHTLYNKVSWTDYFSVMGHGLPLDFSLAGYLTAIPGLLLIASVWIQPAVIRQIRRGYFMIIAILLSASLSVTWDCMNTGDSAWMPLRCSTSSPRPKMLWPVSAFGS